MKRNANILKLVRLALFTAIVIALQCCGIVVKIGATSVSLVLVPIAVGAMLLGPGAGAFLGAVFGAITLFAGVSGSDYFTATLFASQPYATTAICMVKGILAGYIPGIVYKALKSKNDFAATILASVCAPIMNTGIFVLGCFFLVSETLTNNFTQGTTLIYFVFIGCAGVNFVLEFLFNTVLSPAIYRITKAVGKRIG